MARRPQEQPDNDGLAAGCYPKPDAESSQGEAEIEVMGEVTVLSVNLMDFKEAAISVTVVKPAGDQDLVRSHNTDEQLPDGRRLTIIDLDQPFKVEKCLCKAQEQCSGEGENSADGNGSAPSRASSLPKTSESTSNFVLQAASSTRTARLQAATSENANSKVSSRVISEASSARLRELSSSQSRIALQGVLSESVKVDASMPFGDQGPVPSASSGSMFQSALGEVPEEFCEDDDGENPTHGARLAARMPPTATRQSAADSPHFFNPHISARGSELSYRVCESQVQASGSGVAAVGSASLGLTQTAWGHKSSRFLLQDVKEEGTSGAEAPSLPLAPITPQGPHGARAPQSPTEAGAADRKATLRGALRSEVPMSPHSSERRNTNPSEALSRITSIFRQPGIGSRTVSDLRSRNSSSVSGTATGNGTIPSGGESGVTDLLAKHSLKGMLSRHVTQDPTLLRGVDPHVMLEGLGYWWRSREPWTFSREPRSETDVLPTEWEERATRMICKSRQVDALDRFHSHSWRANATIKTGALYQLYNGDAALVCSMCAAFIAAILQALGLLPHLATSATNVYNSLVPGGPETVSVSGWPFFVFTITHLMVLLWWQKIRHILHPLVMRWRAWRGKCESIRTGFFDKLCIHQLRPDLQKKGIDSLGAYLIMSKRFTILWDSTYLTRLWTVFELAIFCRLCPGTTLEFVPNASNFMVLVFGILVRLVFSGMFCVLYPLSGSKWFTTDWTTIEEHPGSNFIVLVPLLAVSVALILFIRQDQRSKRLLHTQLAQFSLACAKCSLERDRVFVTRIVREMYQEIPNFEKYVRGDVADHIRAVCPEGQDCLSWYQVFHIWGAPALVLTLFETPSMLLDAGFDYSRGFVIGTLVFALCHIFLWVKCMCWLSTYATANRTWTRAVSAVALAGVSLVMCLALLYLIRYTGSANFAVQVPIAVLSLLLHYIVHQGRIPLYENCSPPVFRGKMPTDSPRQRS